MIERAAWVERSGRVGDRVAAYGALLTGGEWPGYVEEGAEYGLGSERGAGSRGDGEVAELGQRVVSQGDVVLRAGDGDGDRGEYWWERL